jgi:PAS domain S-box-containing protein
MDGPGEATFFRELEDFFENGLVGLHLVGPDGTILRANRAELAMMGYLNRPEDYVGRHIAGFHVEKRVIDDMLERLLDDRPLSRHPARLVARDGTVRSVLIDSSSRFEGGRFLNTRCFTRPARDELIPRLPAAVGPAGGEAPGPAVPDERLAQLADFFDNARVCLRVTGPDGAIRRANRAELAWMGYASRPGDYVGRPAAGFFSDRAAAESSFERLAAGEPLVGEPIRMVARDGTERPAHLYASARFEDGRFAGARCFTYPEEAGGVAAATPDFSWPSDEG